MSSDFECDLAMVGVERGCDSVVISLLLVVEVGVIIVASYSSDDSGPVLCWWLVDGATCSIWRLSSDAVC